MIVVEGKIRDRIAIIFGRFQPLTKAHYDMIKKAVDMYQNVFVFPVQGPGAFSLTAKTEKGKESERAKKMGRSPLPVGIRIELILKAFPELSSKNVLRLGSGSIEYVYDQLEKMYPSLKLNKLDVFAGEDEFDSYVGQIKYMKEKDKYNDVDVQIKKYDSGTRDVVSATMLRAAITNEDPDKGFEEYKKLVAPPLSDRATYNRLRKVIGRVQRLDLKESMQVLLKIIDRETNTKLKNLL